ncbi:hypothetical protein ACMDCT_14160 [Halomonadaceae bacterium KBTZ08]
MLTADVILAVWIICSLVFIITAFIDTYAIKIVHYLTIVTFYTLAGLRQKTFNSDTEVYYGHFESAQNQTFFEHHLLSRMEPSWDTMTWLFAQFLSPSQSMFIVTLGAGLLLIYLFRITGLHPLTRCAVFVDFSFFGATSIIRFHYAFLLAALALALISQDKKAKSTTALLATATHYSAFPSVFYGLLRYFSLSTIALSASILTAFFLFSADYIVYLIGRPELVDPDNPVGTTMMRLVAYLTLALALCALAPQKTKTLTSSNPLASKIAIISIFAYIVVISAPPLVRVFIITSFSFYLIYDYLINNQKVFSIKKLIFWLFSVSMFIFFTIRQLYFYDLL